MSGPARKLAIGLAISVALNLFLLGMLSVRRFHHGRFVHGDPARALFRADEVFPGDEPRVARILRDHKRELMSQRRAAREARRRVKDALEAEPFDRAALDGRLESLRVETQRSQELLHRAFSELANEANPEQRRRLARSLSFGRRGPPESPPPPPH